MVIVSAVLEHNEQVAIETKLNGSIICTQFCGDTTYTYTREIVYSSKDTTFNVEFFNDPQIKPTGTFMFRRQSCSECTGITYCELRNENDSLLAKQKKYYKGQRHYTNHFSAKWLLSKEKIKIYEYDTLLDKRVYLEDLN